MLNETQKHEVVHAFEARMATTGPDDCPHTLFPEVTDNDVTVEFVRMGMGSLEQAAFLNSIGQMDGSELAGIAEHVIIMALAFGMTYGRADAAIDMEAASDALNRLTGPDGIAWS